MSNRSLYMLLLAYLALLNQSYLLVHSDGWYGPTIAIGV